MSKVAAAVDIVITALVFIFVMSISFGFFMATDDEKRKDQLSTTTAIYVKMLS